MVQILCLKTILIGVCIIVVLLGLYLSFDKGDETHKGSINLFNGEISFEFRNIGLVLLVIGIVGAIFILKYIEDCDTSTSPNKEVKLETDSTNVVNQVPGAIVKGCVIDQDRNPVAGATISFEERKEFTQTGEDGCFELKLKNYSEESIRIKITSKGYKDYLPTGVKTNSANEFQINKNQ